MLHLSVLSEKLTSIKYTCHPFHHHYCQSGTTGPQGGSGAASVKRWSVAVVVIQTTLIRASRPYVVCLERRRPARVYRLPSVPSGPARCLFLSYHLHHLWRARRSITVSDCWPVERNQQDFRTQKIHLKPRLYTFASTICHCGFNKSTLKDSDAKMLKLLRPGMDEAPQTLD